MGVCTYMYVYFLQYQSTFQKKEQKRKSWKMGMSAIKCCFQNLAWIMHP